MELTFKALNDSIPTININPLRMNVDAQVTSHFYSLE